MTNEELQKKLEDRDGDYTIDTGIDSLAIWSYPEHVTLDNCGFALAKTVFKENTLCMVNASFCHQLPTRVEVHKEPMDLPMACFHTYYNHVGLGDVTLCAFLRKHGIPAFSSTFHYWHEEFPFSWILDVNSDGAYIYDSFVDESFYDEIELGREGLSTFGCCWFAKHSDQEKAFLMARQGIDKVGKNELKDEHTLEKVLSAVQTAINSLGGKPTKYFMLRYVDRYEVKDIAQKLKVSTRQLRNYKEQIAEKVRLAMGLRVPPPLDELLGVDRSVLRAKFKGRK